MCGIVGFFLKKTSGRQNFQEKRNFIEQGLYVSAMRGWDATGVAVVKDFSKTTLVYKKAMPSCDFIFLKKTQKIFEDIDDAQAVIGHTRSATLKGISQDENAHPFQFGHITLVHNGHVNNWRNLDAKCEIDVDSAHVAAAISQHGEKETLERLLGDFALVWHNSQDKTINIARNNGRPMHYVELPEWGGYAFASEYELLGALLARNGVKIQDKFWSPREHVHFKFSLENNLKKTAIPFLPGTNRETGPPGNNRKRTDFGKTESGTETMTTQDSPFLGENKELIATLEKHNNHKRHANSGRPGNQRGVDRARARLQALDLDYDRVVGCDLRKFVPYKTGHNLGMAIASMNGKYKGQVAEVQNITKEAFDALSEQGRYILARAVNVKIYDEKKVVVLELKDDFIKEAIEEYRQDLELVAGDPNIKSFLGPGGRSIGLERFLELTKNGCGFCETLIDPKLHELVFWIDNAPVCHKCADDPDCNLALGFSTTH